MKLALRPHNQLIDHIADIKVSHIAYVGLICRADP